VATTRIARHIDAPRARVYEALIDADQVARWRFPTGMTCEVHELDAREGGTLRVSLTYDTIDGVGKSGTRTDTYRGRFVELVPNERVVEVDEFETDDPAFRGEMRSTIELRDEDGGTLLAAVHEGVPDAVPAADNEAGWASALDRLAALVGAV
jgi:uncharacterized protein YndB with AHSA1/START domain